MSTKIILALSLILTALIFNRNAAAQTVGEGTDPVGKSDLAKINLADGARRVKDGMAPAEVIEILRQLVEQGGSRVRQGKSEAIVWSGSYQSSKGAQMIQKLEADLRGAGWEYETAAKEQGATFFTLLRETPVRRALVGFFAPSKESFIFAVTEMLPASADAAEISSAPSSGDVPGSLVGRWTKNAGAGGADDGTNKTLYNTGNEITFEFRADGTMQFTNDENTLSIMQCRITEVMKIPGTYRASGSTLTMNLAAGTHAGTNSCERAGNFKKSITPSTLTKKFVVKRMESVFRPDAPTILCLDGAKDEDCFQKSPE